MRIFWDEDGEEHIASRSVRYPRARDLSIDAVDETADDPAVLVEDADPGSPTTALLVTGYSNSAQCVITIVAERRDDELWGLTAWKASGRRLRNYREASRATEDE